MKETDIYSEAKINYVIFFSWQILFIWTTKKKKKNGAKEDLNPEINVTKYHHSNTSTDLPRHKSSVHFSLNKFGIRIEFCILIMKIKFNFRIYS